MLAVNSLCQCVSASSTGASPVAFASNRLVNGPTEAFIIPHDVASPLVIWPAVEWYFPSIQFTGYLSLSLSERSC